MIRAQEGTPLVKRSSQLGSTSEISQLDQALFVKENVVALDVAMDDMACMEELYSF